MQGSGDNDESVENSKRFLNLTVRGFRRLASVDFELRPLTVLIGANGVGKTSLLDALALLAGSAKGNLESMVNEMSGLAAITTYDRPILKEPADACPELKAFLNTLVTLSGAAPI